MIMFFLIGNGFKTKMSLPVVKKIKTLGIMKTNYNIYFFKFPLIILISTFILACNNENRNIINKVETKTTLKDISTSCTFELDTFSFKGITIGNNIKSVRHKIKNEQPQSDEIESNLIKEIRNGRNFSVGNYQTYEVVNSKNISLFENTLKYIKIHTYKNIIFGIDISLDEDAEKLFHFMSIQSLFKEKFKIPSCGFIEVDDFFDIFHKNTVIDVSSKKLSIKTFFYSSFKKNKHGAEGTSNEFLKNLRIEITDIAIIKNFDTEIKYEFSKSREKSKSDF